MRITCPYCHSDATLAPNAAHIENGPLPLYALACSGCDRSSVRRDNQDLLVAALVGSRHGSGTHELTVTAEHGGLVYFHTDPTGRSTPTLEHSDLLEFVTRSIGASQSFTLLLRTMEVGARFASPHGNIPYKAVRGWVVVDGEIHALTRHEAWAESCREADFEMPPGPEDGVHYVDADAINRPYQWRMTAVS
ncbi:hypothetical protein GY21_16805 [Cryobacterium roopkundense]|uniref:Uncharacterized protein n=1 Tax=Cryobacterium roopkundense TaxID=1001240 RepID=A0A099J3V7_9MICO|nr:hypothetical protein [Cryobacterium roopkundense]KGJ72217.1 hypothetical protein GY21_16805 [Cryobacterium roopkundense]MBB5642838.1 hypothetical protein [Cryobacterium roopkundense]